MKLLLYIQKWSFFFQPVSSIVDHRALRSRSSIEPYEWMAQIKQWRTQPRKLNVVMQIANASRLGYSGTRVRRRISGFLKMPIKRLQFLLSRHLSLDACAIPQDFDSRPQTSPIVKEKTLPTILQPRSMQNKL